LQKCPPLFVAISQTSQTTVLARLLASLQKCPPWPSCPQRTGSRHPWGAWGHWGPSPSWPAGSRRRGSTAQQQDAGQESQPGRHRGGPYARGAQDWPLRVGMAYHMHQQHNKMPCTAGANSTQHNQKVRHGQTTRSPVPMRSQAAAQLQHACFLHGAVGGVGVLCRICGCGVMEHDLTRQTHHSWARKTPVTG
jgi:hypothetical protein